MIFKRKMDFMDFMDDMDSRAKKSAAIPVFVHFVHFVHIVHHPRIAVARPVAIVSAIPELTLYQNRGAAK
jgi:hypothetical protein